MLITSHRSGARPGMRKRTQALITRSLA